MAGRIKRLSRLLGASASEVEEAASCARALAALSGNRRAVASLVSQESSRLTRSVLTGRVISAVGPVPWPSAIHRQLDPEDPAFLPPLGAHLVLSARDATILALPGRPRQAWVDPLGWAGFGDGPAVTVWFGDGRRGYPTGRRPGPASLDEDVTVEQARSDDGHGVITTCTRGGLKLEVFHWPVVLQGTVACAVYARLSLDAPAPRPARLGFALRPVGLEGVEPVFGMERDAEGLWRADGVPLLALAQPGDEIILGALSLPDPWARFSGQSFTGDRRPPGQMSVSCPAGLSSAVEVYRTTLSPGESFARFAIIAPPPEAPASLVRTSGRALWQGSIADRKGMLASGCEITLSAHGRLLDAARQRALIDEGRVGLASCLAAVALARLGFVRRSGQRLSGWMNRVRRDGRLPGATDETPAVLAWAASEYIRWTGERSWLRAHLTPWRRLLDRLESTPLPPGGHALFGADGSDRWSAIWRTAALLHSSIALREATRDHQGWALGGGRAREALLGVLGPAPWSTTDGRAPDGSAAGMLAAVWLGLLSPRHAAVQETLQHIRTHFWHGGGVFSQGGAHPAATALLTAVQQRIDPTVDALSIVAALASPTGTFPSARHPYRGAVGTRDDLLGAALFLMVALDAVRVEKRTLRIMPGIVRAVDLPTPFGRIDIDGDRVVGRWRTVPPRVIVEPRSANPESDGA